MIGLKKGLLRQLRKKSEFYKNAEIRPKREVNQECVDD